MRPYELLIGLRYTRAKRRNKFVSLISLISIVGMSVGIIVLIVVLSIMNGFHKEVRNAMLGAASHVEISEFDGALSNWSMVAESAQKNSEVLASAPYINAQAMLSYDHGVQGALIRGIEPAKESKVVDIDQHMKAGLLTDLRPGEFGIVLGIDLARSLGARIGSKVTVITPQGQVTPAGVLPRLKQFTVVGVFELGMSVYDGGLALMHIEDAGKLLRMNDKVSGLRLRLQEVDRAPLVSHDLSKSLAGDYFIRDWTTLNTTYFRAVKMEKSMMFVIMFFIVGVAAINIVSTLVMAVTVKQADIAILRTMGASPGSIMKIFIVQGTVIGLFGTLIGVVVGVALATNIDVVAPFLERVLGFKFLAKDVYFLSEVPSDVHAIDVFAVAIVSFILSMVATLYPSWRASKTNPAEALRYE